MDCGDRMIQEEFLRRFGRKIAQERIPYWGSFDLTSRCNLRCVHCYVRYSEDQHETRPETDTRKWLGLLDEVRDAGCLNLLLTGGEPLLRKDFCEIYEYAKRIGMLVTIFTNATLLNKEILDLFADMPPCTVEVSLYGAHSETYEAVTGVPGSFTKCMEGIEGLLSRGINVGLKTVLMTLNHHEFFEIRETAERVGVRFRFDASIFPRLDGSHGPLAYRVSAPEVVEKEFSDSVRLSRTRTFYERHRNDVAGEDLYGCGAGLTSFHIDSYGYLVPCLVGRTCRFDLHAGAFLEGWTGVISEFRARKRRAKNSCDTCSAIAVCGYCPAFFGLENGDEHVPSQYVCSLGRERYAALNATGV